MKERPIAAMLLLMFGWIAWACDKKDPNAPDTTTASRIVVSPGSLSFTSLGQAGALHAAFIGSTTPPPDTFWHFSSGNPGIATVSTAAGPNQTVTAVANGGTTIHVTVDTVSDIADIPVTVNAPAPAVSGYNGTYKGEARQLVPPLRVLPVPRPASCPGSDQSYAETATINVSASGAGTFTLTDTPGFDRAYQVTIPASLTFAGTGTFSFLGLAVPGQVSVTINDPTHLTFQETTNWGSCSNVYGGQLTKQ